MDVLENKNFRVQKKVTFVNRRKKRRSCIIVEM